MRVCSSVGRRISLALTYYPVAGRFSLRTLREVRCWGSGATGGVGVCQWRFLSVGVVVDAITEPQRPSGVKTCRSEALYRPITQKQG